MINIVCTIPVCNFESSSAIVAYSHVFGQGHERKGKANSLNSNIAVGDGVLTGLFDISELFTPKFSSTINLIHSLMI